ncbi:P-loop containing nucleoside triphosphate hydrolase protein [Gonapodya prolifera JEL478]|uniref:p-loop containing nucleoside triphosphate hydrolase protein n=1 Tax=Gonapodya prolifera (strain JEL478) TaxID=1344416 RepID=A0A139AW50_GONPJ|nr:P-loop containing nucleoside triphosphate hydrolase protein [Gonapodya prolifera JEL478]|eukprot:KXS20937.1 P-loop containing nucleoside triphosphate hydrolase protein [Gonapodya prolifera JEL478]
MSSALSLVSRGSVPVLQPVTSKVHADDTSPRCNTSSSANGAGSFPLAKPRALAGKRKGKLKDQTKQSEEEQLELDEVATPRKRARKRSTQEHSDDPGKQTPASKPKPSKKQRTSDPPKNPDDDLPPPLARLSRIFRAINTLHSLTCARRDGIPGGGGLVGWDILQKGCEDATGLSLPPLALVPLLPLTHPDLLTLIYTSSSSLSEHLSHTVGGVPLLRPEDDDVRLFIAIEGTGVAKISRKKEEGKARSGGGFFVASTDRNAGSGRGKMTQQHQSELSFSKEIARRNDAFSRRSWGWWEGFLKRHPATPQHDLLDGSSGVVVPRFTDTQLLALEEELEREGRVISPTILNDTDVQPTHAMNVATMSSGSSDSPAPNLVAERPESLLEVMTSLTAEPEYQEQLVEVITVEGRKPNTVEPTSDTFLPTTLATLSALNIPSIYLHQLSSFEHLRANRHLVLATGTGSGKSLVYWCWIAEGIEKGIDGDGWKAMVVYPTKALAQDQLRAMKEFLEAHPILSKYVKKGSPHYVEHFVATYDGDTPNDIRRAIRDNARVILTNPDTLHVAMLPNREMWGGWWRVLGTVVIDELHTHSGSFGSHTSHVFRRLRRMLRLHSTVDCRFLAASATLPDPAGHLRSLVGLEAEASVVAVEDDTSPSGPRHHAVWNPPLIDATRPGLGRRSCLTETAWVARRMVEAGVRCVIFCKYRRMLEILLKVIATDLERAGTPDLKTKFIGYRAGYMPEDRRRIERSLFSGEVMCVVATTALELGVDIGYLDAVIHMGFPFTMAGYIQQVGRAGRRYLDALSLLVCDHLDPVSQHYATFPRELVDGRPEAAPVDPWASQVVEGQIVCAAADGPVDLEVDWDVMSPSGTTEGVEVRDKAERMGWLREQCEQLLIRGPDGLYYVPQGDRWGDRPALKVSIRAIDDTTFLVVNMDTGGILEEIEHRRAIYDLYEGAVFLHQGESFMVVSLNVEKGVARVRQTNVSYITAQRDYTNVDVVRTRARRRCLVDGEPVRDGGQISQDFEEVPLESGSDVGVTVWGFYGDVKVQAQVYGYFKMDPHTRRILEAVDARAMPPFIINTVGTWFDVHPDTVHILPTKGIQMDWAVHSAAHAVMNVVRGEDGGVAHGEVRTECKYPLAERPRPARVTLYDTRPSGSGACRRLFLRLGDLIKQAYEIVEACPCTEEKGCKDCCMLSSCSEENKALTKDGAKFVLEGLMGTWY